MKKIIKKMKSLGIGGFTLIELLGVLVIMGILILVVMPNMHRLINRNNNKDYETYFDLIEYGATQYANEVKSELGSTRDSGCAQVSLSELIDKEYVSQFSKKDISCVTGSHQIRIRNDYGKITVKFSLQCKKGSEEVFFKGEDDGGTCLAYETSEKPSLINKLEERTDRTLFGNYYYITGTNNYIHFSGQDFRIISYDKVYNTIRAVSATPVSPLRFSATSSTTFANSDVELWLNNDYLNTLQPDYKQYLVSNNWKVSSTTTRKATIGLLSREDISHINSANVVLTWLVDNGTASQAYIAGSSGTYSLNNSNMFYEVQPVITFSADVLYYGGNGSQSNPYRVSSDTYGEENQYLNERYAGEYVKINNKKYKMIKVGSYGTKIMYADGGGIGSRPFAVEEGEGALSYMFDASTLGIYLNNDWFNNLGTDKAYLTDGDFCMETINGTTTNRLRSDCTDTSTIKSLKVGLPKLGEPHIFVGTTPFYWTLNPNSIPEGEDTYTNATMNLISGGGSAGAGNIKNEYGVYPVLYIKPEAQIASGKGTFSNPYTLK